MTTALIIGGGIAGAASALALHKAGIDVTVCEAHPRSSEDAGAFLTLAPNGMRALRQIDAADAITRASNALLTMRVCTAAGTEIRTAKLGDPDVDGSGYRYLTRARLCSVLQREVEKRGIPLRHGRRLVRVASDSGAVTAWFSDGSQASADVLVGADGLGSTVRTIIDPSAPAPRYVGQRVLYGYSANTDVCSGPDRFEVVRGATAFGYIVTAQDQTWWFARVTGDELSRDDLRTTSTDRRRADLLALLRDEPAPRAIVGASRRVLVTNAYDLPEVRSWHRDRMLIVGDAAHAASPATGQGASMALEDAVVLAKALRDQPDPDSAFATYERVRRDRVEVNIAISAGMSAPPNSQQSRRSAPPIYSDVRLDRDLDWNAPLS